jgi:hypothetical protein
LPVACAYWPTGVFAERAPPPVESGSLSGTRNPVPPFWRQNKREVRLADGSGKKNDRPPPVVQQRNPDSELEEKLRNNPTDKDAKVDVGSDESMDASDPPSVVQPEADEPVPSSGFDEDDS